MKKLNEDSVIDVVLYVWDKFNERDNNEILLHTIDHIKSTKSSARVLVDHCLL